MEIGHKVNQEFEAIGDFIKNIADAKLTRSKIGLHVRLELWRMEDRIKNKRGFQLNLKR